MKKNHRLAFISWLKIQIEAKTGGGKSNLIAKIIFCYGQ